MPEFSTEFTVLAALVSGAVAKFVFAAMSKNNRRNNMVKVGTVTQLNYYPIKSCRGITVNSALCTPLGVKVGNAVDRHWVVVRSNGDFITQRQFSKMALIQTEVRDNDLVLSAPGMSPLKVPLSIPVTNGNVQDCRVWENRLKAVDCGQEAGLWLSTFLQEPGLRLLWSAPSLPRVDISKKKKPWGNPALPGDMAAFPDFCSYLMISEGSLGDLNGRLKQPVTMNRFRPNIVISGCPAFDEDTWAEVRIGDKAIFRILDPCDRCLLTTVIQEKGERDSATEPLNTLKSYRCFPKFGTSPLFGANATIDVEGVVKVGDPVYAIRK